MAAYALIVSRLSTYQRTRWRDLSATVTPAPATSSATTVKRVVPAAPVSGSWVTFFTFLTWYFRNANRTHHATAGIQQTPVLRVRRTGACGTSVRGTGVRACTRTTLIVRFTRIGHTGTRSAAHISERILRLTQNRLSGFRKPLVIVLGRGERVIRLRIRPARNRLRGSYRRSRQITRRPILQHRRKTANTDRSDNQQRRNRTHRQRFAASVTSLTHFVGNVNRLFERRKATFQRKSTTHRSLFG